MPTAGTLDGCRADRFNCLIRTTSGRVPVYQDQLIGKLLFGKRCVCENVGEVRRREPFDVPDAEIPKDVVNGGRRLLANDVAKADLELVLKCQPREFCQDRALFFLRDSIKTDAEDVHRDS